MKHIIVVAQNFGPRSGGEAIKAYQYAKSLENSNYTFQVFTHERSVVAFGADPEDSKIITVDDDIWQRMIWRIPIIRPLLIPYFHLKLNKQIEKKVKNLDRCIIHYIAPVSPVQLRFAPKGADFIIGPVTGNIYYPDGFRNRMSRQDKIREALHAGTQRILGLVAPEKRRARAVLVSGGERTLVSLRLARCPIGKVINVIDAGVHPVLFSRSRIKHTNHKYKFMFSGRLVDYKGADLVIKALIHTNPRTTLDIFGDGEKREELLELIDCLKLGNRVKIHGWIEHDKIIDLYADYRGYIFPSLAEANGIVVQEAMAAGLPVVALRWGGPAQLIGENEGILIDPSNEENVIKSIAMAMDRLAQDPDYADLIASRARQKAEMEFTWKAVANSWQRAYAHKA